VDAIQGPSIDASATLVPSIEASAIHAPTIQSSVIQTLSIEAPPIDAPAVEVDAIAVAECVVEPVLSADIEAAHRPEISRWRRPLRKNERANSVFGLPVLLGKLRGLWWW
jgi:hypothetical protein